uniref:PHB domain-containing protein n=1 Tax=Caenorhabditis tropicalis TaxID=1561998 RepID=A0A1I7T066_9PELO
MQRQGTVRAPLSRIVDLIFRLGRLKHGGARGPGIFFIIPCIESFKKIDLRVVSFDVPPQEVINVEDAARSTKLLAQTTLRNFLGTRTLAEMLSSRDAISMQMQAALDEATDPWGVKVRLSN